MTSERTGPRHPVLLADADPDVLALAPPTRRRSVLAATAVAALALGAAWSSAELRPALVHGSSAAGAAEELTDGRVLTGLQLRARSIGPLEVVGVDDVPGARVLGAWVAPASPGPDRAPDGLFDGDPVRPEPGSALGAAQPVPAAVPDGDDAWLVVLWEVTDCDRAQSAVDGPVAHLRTALGLVVEETLPDIAGPGYACPA